MNTETLIVTEVTHQIQKKYSEFKDSITTTGACTLILSEGESNCSVEYDTSFGFAEFKYDDLKLTYDPFLMNNSPDYYLETQSDSHKELSDMISSTTEYLEEFSISEKRSLERLNEGLEDTLPFFKNPKKGLIKMALSFRFLLKGSSFKSELLDHIAEYEIMSYNYARIQECMDVGRDFFDSISDDHDLLDEKSKQDLKICKKESTNLAYFFSRCKNHCDSLIKTNNGLYKLFYN